MAGEAMGIAGIHAAKIRGKLAAEAICKELGLQRVAGIDTRRLQGKAGALAAFTRLTSTLFPVPEWLYQAIPDETIVCRCEAVTAWEVRQVADSSRHDIHAVKAATRAGMGICQGRQCGNTIAALGAATWEARELARGRFLPRMPLKPILVPAQAAGREDHG
jgi:hypothetical protein